MSEPVFNTGEDLFEYVVSIGPLISDEQLESLRGGTSLRWLVIVPVRHFR